MAFNNGKYTLEELEEMYRLAKEGGVKDRSYNTVANGGVSDFRGKATITRSDGKRFRAIGHRPKGTPEWVAKRGWIEFREIK